MTLVLIIVLLIVGGLAYGLWMASQLGLLSLWPRSPRRPPESLSVEDGDDRGNVRNRTTGRG